MLQQHKDRNTIQDEAHARPPMLIDSETAEIWHYVLFDASHEAKDWPFGLDPDARHQVIETEDGRLRFERHSEFVSLTFVGDDTPLDATLALIHACPGSQLAGARIRVQPKTRGVDKLLFGTERLFGGGVGIFNGVEVATNFQVDEDGLVRYLVTGSFEDGYARGRLVKRLLDVETYRMASLLALPLVRGSEPRLRELEAQAATAAAALAGGEGGLDPAIAELAHLLAEVGALKDRLRFRIGASLAYDALVQARLATLDERMIGQRQTLGGFIEHRLAPGMASIRSFERRVDALSNQISASLSLARTQLDHISQRNSQDLLASMATRARQQVQLSQAVEGFSVAAITYYAVGLIGYVLKGAPPVGISDDLIVAGSILPVAAAVVFLSRRLRKRVDRLGGKPEGESED